MVRESMLSKEQTNCIKAFAIICVVTCHVLGHYTRIVTPLGGIGVCIFLMLSGYGLALSADSKGLKGYWRKRIISVVIPYAILETLYVVSIGGISLKAYILDILLIQPRFLLGWYLNYILICYCYFYIIERMCKTERIKMMLYFGVSIALLIYSAYTKDGLRFEQSFSFLLGIVVARYDVSKFLNCRVIWINVITGMLLLAIKQIPFIRGTILLYDTFNLFLKTFIATACIISIKLYWNDVFCKLRITECLNPIGKASYIIYLVHGYLLALFDIMKEYRSWMVVAVFILCCIIGTLLYYHIIRCVQQRLSVE